jgi:glycosyltransferase involved in cell wall biosynthesis
VTVFLYGGSLSAARGTTLLLDAFRRLEGSQYRLWITGEGDARADVEAAAAADPRIQYWGFVSYDNALELYRRATILVNPHLTGVRSGRYQFPSKLIEYLASGRPVVSTRTPEIEREYGDVVVLAGDESPDALAAAMRETAARSEADLAAFGIRGREFVLREKTWERQGARIAGFLREVVARAR